MKNKIVLFEWTPRSAMAWIILIATGCPFSHAAIEINGKLYDASERRGTLAEADVERLRGRPCQVCEFEADLSQWLRKSIGKKYDYTGVLGWMACRFFNRACGNRHRFYCFETVNDAMKAAGFRGVRRKAVSGCDIRNALPGAPRYAVFGE